MNRPVSYARLHQSVYVPNVGDIGPRLPNEQKVIKDFRLVACELGLLIYATSPKGFKVEAFTPWVNVQVATFDVAAEFSKPVIVKGKSEAA